MGAAGKVVKKKKEMEKKCNGSEGKRKTMKT